eukprot:gnl/TRDRNA2_/TRDRNA2_205559_c0_seq1.p1 gnl/TRDRNA2_/TRDRNA2_205559_c0~~gnl/TRDRNA2_/TRDRNA2_205559_c0_seq1.p1  ORF type:complete len:320 (+),score=40.56 gnl/TRDRNA2_/TRDRNA2_205559_c0_seq1:46-960(+)
MSREVHIGTLTLSASDDYLAAAEQQGLAVYHWVSGYVTIVAHYWDLQIAKHHQGIRTALALLQGVKEQSVAVSAAHSFRRLAHNGGNTAMHRLVHYVTQAEDNSTAHLIADRILSAVAGGEDEARFIATLDGLVPDALVSGALFEPPWVDAAVYRAGSSEPENPLGLPWWPHSRVEMFLCGFIIVGLFLLTCSLLLCCACGCNWKRAPATEPERFLHADNMRASEGPKPTAVAAEGPATEPGTVLGRPTAVGGMPTSPPHRVISELEQNEAVEQMLDMGFDYGSSIAALQRNNYEVSRAVSDVG